MSLACSLISCSLVTTLTSKYAFFNEGLNELVFFNIVQNCILYAVYLFIKFPAHLQGLIKNLSLKTLSYKYYENGHRLFF